MSDANIPIEVSNIITMHRNKASQSAYDRTVAIQAIASAAYLIENFNWTGSLKADLEVLLPSLESFRNDYYDSDGEYTSGKAEIGSLVVDLNYLLTELKES